MLEYVTKRDGRAEHFDRRKIYQAIYKCLNIGLSRSEETSGAVAEDITQRVINLLEHQEGSSPTVEDIQNRVEEQLMAAGHFEAARAYILYRREHHEARLKKPVDPEEAERIRRNNQYFPDPLQQFQFYDKYSRYREDLGRRETWEESVDRVINYLKGEVLAQVEEERIPGDIWEELREAILWTESLPSMRVLQMAGPALWRCNVGAYNCSYVPLDSLSAFGELLYVLMQGTGAGFSAEIDYVDRLPRIRRQKANHPKETYIIPDDTEGWCDALVHGLERWFAGEDLVFDYSRIRPQGAPLRTKGGRASGPEPLKNLLTFVRERVLARQGDRLSTLDAHDIACMIGRIVQVGGVRRAAEISLSDQDDEAIRHCKDGAFWNTAPWRTMANNSVVFEEKPSAPEFLEFFLALVKGGSGEPGIFNREGVLKQIPRRRRRAKFGVNPCGEIILRPRQFCNLSVVVARPTDTRETLRRKVYYATVLGTLQSMLTRFEYLPAEWKKNCDEERLLGVDITGQVDCPLLRPGTEGREALLRELRDYAVQVNQEWAEILGIPPSAAVTCVKPSGNSAALLGCGSGIHARFGAYIIRRVRCASYSPIAQLLKDAGVPWYPEYNEDPQNPQNLVFEFVVKSPEGAVTRHDQTALDQLENWRALKQNWTEHNPSCTVYVGENEWVQVACWLYDHWDYIGGLSFLPKSDHVYPLAPLEEISQEEYERRAANFPVIDWAKLPRYEGHDQTNVAVEFACSAGGCELN